MLYEQRIYHAMPGRMPDLLKRFESITLGFFERYGIRQAGFWTIAVGGSTSELIYLLQWESMAEREQKWNAFASDPDWVRQKAETEAQGPLVDYIANQFLQPTAFSAVR
ncbi:NIPSNAP family protein [Silvimonas sp. JCM 19000]